MLSAEIQIFYQPLGRLYRQLAPKRGLNRLSHLFEQRYLEPSFGLKIAATECGIEKNHLNFLLRRTIGLTFHQLLIRRRVFRALELMRTTDLNLLEIAFESGFGSPSSFARNFARVLGDSPSEYRKRSERPNQITGKSQDAAVNPDFRRVFC